MSKALYENAPTLERPFRVIKREDRPRKTDDQLMRDHELGMLHLLVRRYKTEAVEIVRRETLDKR